MFETAAHNNWIDRDRVDHGVVDFDSMRRGEHRPEYFAKDAARLLATPI